VTGGAGYLAIAGGEDTTKLPFTKGIWLAAMTGLLVACLAPGAFLATLGCGAAMGDAVDPDDPVPEHMDVWVRIFCTALTPTAVPAANQTVHFSCSYGEYYSAPRGSFPVESKTTGPDGTCVFGKTMWVNRDENVYVLFWLEGAGAQSQLTTFTWGYMLLHARRESQGAWHSSPIQHVRLTLPGTALE